MNEIATPRVSFSLATMFATVLTLIAIPMSLLPAKIAMADGSTRSSDADPAPTVLIPPFVNAENRGRSTAYTDAARERLEDLLVNKKIKVVERSRVDQILKESEFSSKSTLTDSELAAKMGKALGANIIVMGTILDVTTDSVRYSDSKIRTEKITVRAGVRIRVVDMSSSTIIFSKEFEGHQSYDSSSNGSKTTSDAATRLIKKAIADAGDTKDFIDAVNGKAKAPGNTVGAPKEIELSFEPITTNCDILVDGEYRGGSPQKIRLPLGKSVKITIRKAGYEPWEATLKPSPESIRKVNPELAAVSGTARPAKE